jgi:uncharacterized protein YbjT (DUF2867 family)
VEVLVTGGTGAIGRPLVERLLARGHRVRCLVRSGSAGRVPGAATPIAGDALDERSVAAALRPGDTLVHLVGTPHPNPAKAASFERVDLASIRASVAAATDVGVAHLVYVSVAQPAPVMKAYVAVRARGEALIADARLTATIVRPWYVLGPGHRWPLVLLPLYALARMLPVTREQAERLGLVGLAAMVTALTGAVEHPPEPGTRRIVDVRAIRAARLA